MANWSPAQSDVVVKNDPAAAERAQVELLEKGAGPTSTKWVYILMAIVIVALIVMITVGAHNPGGG